MNTNPASHCPRCGSTLEPAAIAGLCPKCLMARAAFATEDDTLPVTSAPAPSLEQIAMAFPELEVLELIGRGGMGVVYKARQKSLNRLVALKLLAPERVQDAAFAERFAKEAQALAALSHPNIVTIHDFGHTEGFYFLLMEFVDGVNLRQAMSAGRFTPEQALAIVPPVCEALQYAHDHGIVHRDIKPENLLLDKDGRVKIADFGIAKMVERTSKFVAEEFAPTTSESRSTLAIGTPRYAAPEQQSDPQHVDHRADIYSLGVVLYELLTGEAPGRKLTPPSHRVQMDVRLDEVVLRALNEKPELRWQTAADLRTQVQSLAHSPVTRADKKQQLYHSMGFHTVWGQRLLKLSLIGVIGFLGFVPGLEKLSVLSVFLVFLFIASLIEWLNRQRQAREVMPRQPWWKRALHNIVIALLIALPLRAWVLEAYVIPVNAMEPELPKGSRVLVWKLTRQFAPGDIIVHRHGDQVWVSRIVRVEGDTFILQRNQWPEEKLPNEDVIGKVVSVYWRASTSKSLMQIEQEMLMAMQQERLRWATQWPARSRTEQTMNAPEPEPPVLHFLHWQQNDPSRASVPKGFSINDDPPDPAGSRCPDGKPVAATIDKNLIDSVKVARLDTRDPEQKHVRSYLQLVFTHAGFDSESLAEAKFFGADGREITPSVSSQGLRRGPVLRVPQPSGWLSLAADLTDQPPTLLARIELRASYGAWTKVTVNPSYGGLEALTSDVNIGSVGNTRTGDAFISFTCSGKTLADNQWEVEALLDDDKKLTDPEMTRVWRSGVTTAEFRFPTSVRKVQSFLVMFRPIRLTVFKDVTLAPYPNAKQ